MRLRTIPEAATAMRAADPDTKLTVYLLRRMVKAGIVPVTQVGNRQFVDLDRMEEYLSGERMEKQPEPVLPFGIRPVKE